MQAGEWSEIAAIASRDLQRAQGAAEQFGIAKAYGSYEELLADPEIEAIYNPLPNHLHVPWTRKAMEAGKHVLCEKPISLTVEEAKTLLEARERTGRKCGEAFMVDSHPQWLRARELVRTGKIGSLRAIAASFSYFDVEPKSIHNNPEGGGGALLDIGAYFAIYFWRGADAGDGIGGTRPGDEDRSADFGDSGVSFRAGDVHLQHAIGVSPEHGDFWHARADCVCHAL